MRQIVTKLSAVSVALLSCTALADGAHAWQVAATTNQEVLTQIANASPGDTIVVPSWFDGPLVISGKHYSSPVTIRNDSTRVQSIVVRDSSNIIIEGGAVIGGPNVTYAVHIDHARSIAIQGMSIMGAVRGVVINRSESIGVFQNRLSGLRTDGINAAESRKIVIEGNSCSNFNPVLPVYDAAGTLIKDGDHPDCIQLWSRPTTAPTADIVIRGNSMTGYMQGIFLGNHVRNGVDDGGFDRVVIENNYMNISFPNGIAVGTGRVVRIVGNQVMTVDGARLLNGAGSYVKATIKAPSSTDVVACNNFVEAVQNGFGTGVCSGDAPPAPVPYPEPTPEPVAPEPEPTPEPVAPVPAPEPAPAPEPTPEPVAPAPAPAPEPTPEPVAPAPAPAPEPTPEPVAPAPAPAPEPVAPAPAPAPEPTPEPVAPAPAPAPEPVAPAPEPTPEPVVPAPAPAPAPAPEPTPEPVAPAPAPAPAPTVTAPEPAPVPVATVPTLAPAPSAITPTKAKARPTKKQARRAARTKYARIATRSVPSSAAVQQPTGGTAATQPALAVLQAIIAQHSALRSGGAPATDRRGGFEQVIIE